jgi:hypothetical protein
MDKHWTITIQVHEVTPPEPIRDGNGYAVKVNQGLGKQAVVMTDRQVAERFSTTVRADSEAEAYRKAMALLEVNRPEPMFSEPAVPEQHLHRASCDDAGGNRMCGYPDGPSIASVR